MQITFLGGKCKVVLLLIVGVMNVNVAWAGGALPWVGNDGTSVDIKMSDGTVYGLRLFENVDGVYYDEKKHQIGQGSYISVFHVSSSNSGKPMGYCGAGSEVWLYVYKVLDQQLVAQTRVLVSSCLRSLSMVSQNTGREGQDTDFSSVQWSAEGFSVRWFNNVDAIGRPIRATNYIPQGDKFLARDVVGP